MSTHGTGKEKILESALVEFAEKGYEGARVDRIAADAGVNKALIYYHFNSKEELYEATFEYIFLKATPLKAEITSGSTKDMFFHMLEGYITFLHHNPLFVKLMDQEVVRGGELFERIEQQSVFFKMGLTLYEVGVKKGEFRELPHPTDYLVNLIGACYFFYSHRNSIKRFYDPALTDAEILQIRIQSLKDMGSRLFFA
jgi:TetR/AcrR family transcriptional regulator